MKELLIAAMCLSTLAACGGSGGDPMTEDPAPTDAGGDAGGGETGGDAGNGDSGDGDTGDETDGVSGGDAGGGIDVSALNFDADLLAVNDSFPSNAFREEISDGSTPDGSNGYAFEAGVLSDNTGLVANANILTGGALGFVLSDAPASGMATLQSTYNAVRLSNPTVTNGQVEVTTTRSRNAPITLTADFTPAGLATLTGTDGTLTVDGTFSALDITNSRFGNGSLNGTVTYQGITGDLTGFVGGAETIGAFAGQDDSSVFSGGFVND